MRLFINFFPVFLVFCFFLIFYFSNLQLYLESKSFLDFGSFGSGGETEAPAAFKRPVLNRTVVKKPPAVLDSLGLDCESLIQNPRNESVLAKNLKNSKFFQNLEAEILAASATFEKCTKIDELFNFRKAPMSNEEDDYPLAYGILAYQNIVQVLFMLASFYHPQNEYCIGVGQNSNVKFHDALKSLTECWPNVHFMSRPPMAWGEYEIINSVYTCLEFMTHLKTDWKYFQYLSGVDVPLKTNLEMVRIFKALNGTTNFDVVPFQTYRLKTKKGKKKMSDSPLPLYKSSLSVLIPRKTADEMAFSSLPRDLLHFLNGTVIPDESFWGSLLGNQELFNISGSISSTKWLETQKNATNLDMNLLVTGVLLPYYISRHQIWLYANKTCHGKYVHNSCTFSIGDLPSLKESKALVAHKMYADYFPAAFFCALKEIQKRSDSPESYPFDTKFYENLPQVEMTRGISMENVTKTTLFF